MAGPEVSQLAFFPWCIQEMWFIRLDHLLPLFYSPVLIHCSCFLRRAYVSMNTLNGLCSLIHSKLGCTVCSDTLLSEPAWTFLVLWASVTIAGKINESWAPMSLSPVHQLSFLWPLWLSTNHCRWGICSTGNVLNRLTFLYNLSSVKIAQIHRFAQFAAPKLQGQNVHLHPNWQLPNNPCYSLHLSVVIMLWLIGV